MLQFSREPTKRRWGRISSMSMMRTARIPSSEGLCSGRQWSSFLNSNARQIRAGSRTWTRHSKSYDAERIKIENEWNDHLWSHALLWKASLWRCFWDCNHQILPSNWRHSKPPGDKYPIGKQKDGALSVIPFNSAHKFAFKVVRCKRPDSDWCVFLKGAPERVWDKCPNILCTKERSIPYDKKFKQAVDDANATFAKGGQRILGFAKYHLPRGWISRKPPLQVQWTLSMSTFLWIGSRSIGLVSLIDPPRDTVPDAIRSARLQESRSSWSLEISRLTAAAIAKTIGIFEDETSVEYQERLGCSYEEAVDKAKAIVVNGEMLTKAYQEDEGLPENKQGKKLERWLQKPQIVFAELHLLRSST